MTGKKVFRLNKHFFIVFAVAVFLIILCILFSKLWQKSGEISLYYSPDQQGVVVFSDDKLEKNIIPGKSISGVRSNSKGDFSAVLMSDDSSYSLYSVSDGFVKKVADNCTNNFVSSFKGEKVVYVTAVGNLCSSDGKTIDESVNNFAVSPNGNVVIYAKTQENSEKLYLFADGEKIFVADNYFPLGVSDNGKYLYVLAADDSLCILNPDGTMKSKLCSNVNTEKFYFSEDMNDIVFYDQDYTYISRDGKSRIRLVKGNAVPVFEKTSESAVNSHGTAIICNDDDLTGLFYSAENDEGTYTVYFIKNDSEKTDISGAVKKFMVTGSKSMTYLDYQGKIYKFGNDKNELVTSGAKDIAATENNKYIYYLTTAYELFAIKGKRTEQIASDAEKIYIADKHRLLFITTDKTLYSVSGKKAGKQIDSNVNSCRCLSDAVFYSKNFSRQTGTFDLYSSANGKNFRFAASDIIS